MRRSAIALCCSLISTASLSAAPVDFVRDVRPILIKHCYECHAGDVRKSGLRLDIRSEAMKGGELYGPAIQPGKPHESPLFQFIADETADLAMPPEGAGLAASEVAILKRWVTEGAAWPADVDTAKLEDPHDHWSFQPIDPQPTPMVADAKWLRNEIDRYVLARLEEAGLQPAPETDRVSWLRRVSLDLIGLPPTPEETKAFVEDRSTNAYEQVVERLLASPRYGERWAQHWLDVVRYADTHGFEVNTERPNAWPYRDYVISALNQDTPYDQFIREQIVGDAMNQDAATGFLVTASVLLPGQIGKDAASIRLARQDSLDEIVTNIGTTFLGLTINCARCHDHKFDAISQRDYYEMQAFVSGVEYADRQFNLPVDATLAADILKWKAERRTIDSKIASLAPEAMSGRQRGMVNSHENIDRFTPIETEQLRFSILGTNKYEPCIDELEIYNVAGRNVALAANGAIVVSSGDNVSINRHELRLINDGRYGNSNSWMSNVTEGGWVVVEFPQKERIDRVVWGRDREGKFSDRLAIQYEIEILDSEGQWRSVADSTDRRPFDPQQNARLPFAAEELMAEHAEQYQMLQQDRLALESKIAAAENLQTVFAGNFREPDEIHVLGRGSPEMPKEEVAPAVLAVLGDVELSHDAAEQQRRKTLADWIARAENPLTARVMVNRIWQGHFGSGLIETANDLGRYGTPPTHPRLLDWLSAEFIRSGWSIKQMHRLIVLSATYRQATTFHEQAEAIDADEHLIWRYPLRRLSGETIRDSILAINGKLNLKMGGPGFDLFDKRGGLSGFNPVESFQDEGLRRMIYAHRVRRERDAVFGAFDCPDYGQSTPHRRESTTPIQALNLLNSRFVIEQSAALADRVIADVGEDPPLQIHRAYQLVLNRDATQAELVDGSAAVAELGLAPLCRALLNSNEFLFIP
ncbi:PSD1 and planctomycete cytochrome C domain-containing protein [Blastopirellula sp. J2-11]|uniref:PSD1 and planctomycete cytochrome C domain-containing protein n=1 Tax=Blastopirellula sp. J2-11 TaxID=2943192 RepID=UPI0021C6FE26|nr:PSD1 and planctomycete cytochrome C domain-containing protein [Blastopirellula sp. J2-11]UUO05774.1 PSD1 and planctomycete cytochrome C domain-containing protein [Blastopirellula sp. J2-11]